MRKWVVATCCALAALASAAPAHAQLPYGNGPQWRTDPGQVPNDLDGAGNTFKFAATPEDNNFPVNQQQSELCGVRGGWIADVHASYAFSACPPDPGGTRTVTA